MYGRTSESHRTKSKALVSGCQGEPDLYGFVVIPHYTPKPPGRGSWGHSLKTAARSTVNLHASFLVHRVSLKLRGRAGLGLALVWVYTTREGGEQGLGRQCAKTKGEGWEGAWGGRSLEAKGEQEEERLESGVGRGHSGSQTSS